MSRRAIVLLILAGVLIGGFFLVGRPRSPGRDLLNSVQGQACFERSHKGAVAAVGDSITAGGGRPDWGFQMKDSWFGRSVCGDGAFRYGINASWHGQTTAEMLGRVDDVVEQRPRAAVILGGTNDLLQGVRLEVTVRNILQMAGTLQKAGAAVAIGTVPPLRSDPAAAARLNDAIRKQVPRAGYTVIDFAGVLGGDAYRPGLAADGVHPSGRGAEAMAQAARPVIERLLAAR